MWSRIKTPAECRDCRPPFSFFFDLIGRYSGYPSGEPHVPLHRVCTLARKMGAESVQIEDVVERPDVSAAITDLDTAYGGQGAAAAIAFSFFSVPAAQLDISRVEPWRFIGQAILINYQKAGSATFTDSFIHEAILRPPHLAITNAHAFPLIDADAIPEAIFGPHATNNIFSHLRRTISRALLSICRPTIRMPLLNNYLAAEHDFSCSVRGRELTLSGIYYTQQNRVTTVCAHACLQMALRTIGGTRCVSAGDINRHLGLAAPMTSGLTIPQIQQIIDANGFSSIVIDCENRTAQDYLPDLFGIVGSGFPAMLGFSTMDGQGNKEAHVVTAFGNTHNSDEWHPEALPAYSGAPAAPYYSSSAWVDHFLIHDDGFGPHYAISSRALERPNELICIIGVVPSAVKVQPSLAEAIAAAALGQTIIQMRPSLKSQWGEYIAAGIQAFVLRTFLISKQNYLSHISNAVGHDRSRVIAAELLPFDGLPDQFWCTEFSLPSLYTGNRSKLGEVLVRSDQEPTSSAALDHVLALRLPGWIVTRDAVGSLNSHHSSLVSHALSYRRKSLVHEW